MCKSTFVDDCQNAEPYFRNTSPRRQLRAHPCFGLYPGLWSLSMRIFINDTISYINLSFSDLRQFIIDTINYFDLLALDILSATDVLDRSLALFIPSDILRDRLWLLLGGNSIACRRRPLESGDPATPCPTHSPSVGERLRKRQGRP